MVGASQQMAYNLRALNAWSVLGRAKVRAALGRRFRSSRASQRTVGTVQGYGGYSGEMWYGGHCRRVQLATLLLHWGGYSGGAGTMHIKTHKMCNCRIHVRDFLAVTFCSKG